MSDGPGSLLVASLPMYDLPEVREDTDRLWTAIAARLRSDEPSVPATLSRPEVLSMHWRDPNLLLSQSCGYPLLELPATVRVVATPAYRAEGCDSASYRSAIVVRASDPAATVSDLRGLVAAINGWDSNSGMNLLRASLTPHATFGRFLGRIVETGSHHASLRAVSEGTADLAAIDCVTLGLLRRYRPNCWEGLRILGWSVAAPGLPLISAGDDRMVAALRRALRAIERDELLRPTLDRLLIDRFVVLPDDAYDAIAALERRAEALGYPLLA